MSAIKPLGPELLCQDCDPDQFTFETTAELEPLTEIIGQERAIEAMRFGITIHREGYNLFAMGAARYREVHRHPPIPRPKGN